MTNRTASAAAAELTALNARDFVFYAKSMLHTGGIELTADQRAHLARKADVVREITGTTDKVSLAINVQDVYMPTYTMGKLVFKF